MSHPVDALARDPEIAPLLQVNYFRKHQRDEHRQEIAALDRVLKDPEERKHLANAGRLQQQNDRRRANLEAQTPPPLTGSQKDKLARLEAAALESAREGLLPKARMRAKDDGAVDEHRAWETAKKTHVLYWKRARLLLNPDSDARDLCNLEKYRPRTPDSRDLMVNAQIPGVFTLSPQAKANYDQIDWTSPEAQAEIQRLVDDGKIRIRTGVRRPLRLPKDGGKVYECAEHGEIFSGPMAAARHARHRKRHRAVEIAPA